MAARRKAKARQEVPAVTGAGMDALLRGVSNLDRAFFQLTSSGGSVSASDVLEQPFAYNAWVYRCVQAYITNLSTVPVIEREKSKPENTRTTSPVLDRLAEPNPLMSWGRFKQMIISALLLPPKRKDATQFGGQCFVVPWSTKRDAPAEIGKGEIPDELYPYTDECFEPMYAEGARRGMKRLVGWEYKLDGQDSGIKFTLGQIIVISTANPYDWLRGLPAFRSCMLAVDADARGDFWNARQFENDAQPGGVLSTDQLLDPTQRKLIKDSWYEQHGGPANARRIALLWGGLKWQQTQISPKDMEWEKQKTWGRDQIIGSFGLNKIGVGDYEQLNLATIREGRKMLWHDAYMPLDKLIMDELNRAWVRYVDGGRWVVGSDYSGVESLKDDLQAKAVTGGVLVTQWGFPPVLAARIAGIPLTDEDVAKWPSLSEPPNSGLDVAMPEGQGDEAPDNDADDEKPEDEKPEEDKAKAITKGKRSTRPNKEARQVWVNEYVAKTLDPAEKSFALDMRKYFVAQRNKIEDAIDAWADKRKSIAFHPFALTDEWVERKAKGSGGAVDPEEFMLSEAEWDKRLMKMYLPNVEKQLRLERAAIESEIGPIQWSVNDSSIEWYAHQRATYLQGINNTTSKAVYSRVSDIAKQAIEQGWTVVELKDKLHEGVRDVMGGRINNANTIARTEMGSIASRARYDAFRTEGIDKWEWVTYFDSVTRDDHKALNGEVRNVGDSFGFGLRYPRDEAGGPEQTINCVLPGTMVSGSFVAGLKADYSGDSIEIETRSGKRLCVTVNHPIATPDGFVPASGLRKGDCVVCHRSDGWLNDAWRDNDKQNRPARVEDVFNAIASHGTTRIHSPSSFDLDGDGKFVENDINLVVGLSPFRSAWVVKGDSPMVSRFDSSRREFGHDISLVSSGGSHQTIGGAVALASDNNVSSIVGATPRHPRSGALALDEVGVVSDSQPLDVFSFGLASKFDVSRYQYRTDSTAGYSMFLSDLVLAHPGCVEFDDVISVRRVPFSGHVYDLQSTVGYFDTNNILSRNCRCATAAVLDDGEDEEVQGDE